MDTLELKDALLLDRAEMMCAVHEQIRRRHPVTYKKYGPGGQFGLGFETNIAAVFGFQTPEDEESFNEVARKIQEAVDALELSEVVNVHEVCTRGQISGKKTYPAEYEVTVAVSE